MKILALDTASMTGFCYGDINQSIRPLSGVWNFKKTLDESKHDSNNVRFARVFKTLVDFLRLNKVDLAVFERKQGQYNDSLVLQSSIDGIIKAALATKQIKSIEYASTTVKKHATGNGRAKKPEMIKACRDLLGINPKDDNEADACLIWNMARDKIKEKAPEYRNYKITCPHCGDQHTLRFKSIPEISVKRKKKNFVAICPVKYQEIYTYQ